MKSFSRHQNEAQIEKVDLHSVIDNAIQLAWNEIKHKAKITRSLSTTPQVLGCASRLAQVILNILINAVQAFETDAPDHNEITISTNVNPNGDPILTIKDNGKGIPPHLLPRIFDPFFTTKPDGVGTGLGLSICHSIIQSMGGQIFVQSEVGQGTAFTLIFPGVKTNKSQSEPAKKHTDKKLFRTRHPNASILVIDDEVSLLEVIEKFLAKYFKVHTMSSSKAVLELFTSPSKPHFDVILCDMSMPELSGVRLFKEIKGMVPEAARKFIFLTGGATTHAISEFIENITNPILEKPFIPKTLLAKVESILDGLSN